MRKQFDMTGNKIANILVIIGLTLIPLLYAGLLTYSYTNPIKNISNLTAAVVNLDKEATITSPITKETKTLNIGAEVEKNLTEKEAGFTWVKDNYKNAQEKLHNGTYNAVLIIPKDLTSKTVQFQLDNQNYKHEPVIISLQTDDGINYLTGSISETVSREIQSQVRLNITESISKQILDSIYLVKQGVSKAGQGATQLADGSGRLQAGIEKLQAGSNQFVAKLPELTNGTQQLSDASLQLLSGSQRLQNGLYDLNGASSKIPENLGRINYGLKELKTKTQPLPEVTQKLSDGTDQINKVVNQILSPENINELQANLQKYGQIVETLIQQNPDVEQQILAFQKLNETLETHLQKQTNIVTTVNEMCSKPPMAGIQECETLMQNLPNAQEQQIFAASKQELQKITEKLTRLNILVKILQEEHNSNKANNMQKMITNLDQLKGFISKINEGANTLNTQSHALYSGISKLSDGTNLLYEKTLVLPKATQQLSDGSVTLSDGLYKLSNGANKLNAGVGIVASKLPELTNGINQLANGSQTLHEGNQKLADALNSAEEKIPNLSESGKENIGKHLAEPLKVTPERVHPVVNNGAGFAPFFLALAMWIGSIGIFFVVPGLDYRRSKNEHWSASAIRAFEMAAIFSVLQSLVLGLLIHSFIDLGVKNIVGFTLFTMLVSITFVSINQALLSLFSYRGRFVSLILLILQITSMGASFPVETTPRIFQILNPYLPMTYVTRTYRAFIAGSGYEISPTIIILIICLIVSILLTLLGAKLRRNKGLIPLAWDPATKVTGDSPDKVRRQNYNIEQLFTEPKVITEK